MAIGQLRITTPPRLAHAKPPGPKPKLNSSNPPAPIFWTQNKKINLFTTAKAVTLKKFNLVKRILVFIFKNKVS